MHLDDSKKIKRFHILQARELQSCCDECVKRLFINTFMFMMYSDRMKISDRKNTSSSEKLLCNRKFNFCVYYVEI